MKTLEKKVVAVTGAASGIGRALAVEMACRGAHVALSDIDERGLRETMKLLPLGTKATKRKVDVRDRYAVEKWASTVERLHGGVDVIINNAAIAVRASIEDISYEDFRFVIDVNLWGVIYGTKAFLPLLRKRQEGHIVNISSINGMIPFALNGPYNVSKYAVLGLNETLMQELRGEPVHITSVHPGGVKTNIVRHSKYFRKEDIEAFGRIAMTTPEQAARAIIDGILHDEERVYVGWDAKMMALAKRLLPAETVRLFGAITSMWTR